MPKPTPETPEALQAFEDFYSMGEGRSLRKLAGLYRGRSADGQAVPTKRENTLGDWSARWGWQERCKQRIAEEAESQRMALRERVKRHRERLLGAIEVDSARLIERLRNTSGEVLAQDAGSLEKLTKLYFQLAEEPLAERHDVNLSEKDAVDDLPDAELVAIAGRARLGQETTAEGAGD